MLEATLEGEELFKAAWDLAYDTIRQSVRTGVTLGAKDGAALARSAHKFKNRTGDLERSIGAVIVGWDGEHMFVAKIVATKKYASWVENGTRPHMITGNPFLVFMWKGVLVRFRYVNHPGQKIPLPFMGPAYFKAEAVAVREIESGVARAQEILDR